MVDRIAIPTAGYHESRPKLIVDVGKTWCGDVADGVAMRFEHHKGGFVVSWPELKAAYEANAAIREKV